MRYTLFLITLIIVVAFMQNHNVLAEASDHQQNTLPSNSIYHLVIEFEDHSGQSSTLDRYRGHPVLITMFYGNCPHICPMLLSTIQQIEKSLLENERNKLRILGISIDPEHDTPDNLFSVAKRHKLDLSRWSLLRPHINDVRSISGVLGVRYRKLDNGEFNHSTKITLLNIYGVPIADTEKLGIPDPEFIAVIQKNINH